jgi:hypothetical protein
LKQSLHERASETKSRRLQENSRKAARKLPKKEKIFFILLRFSFPAVLLGPNTIAAGSGFPGCEGYL